MENIFEGAKFGDKFQMRNGWIAIYLSHYTVNDNSIMHRLCTELDGIFVVDNAGHVCQSALSNDWDIVSRYQEPSLQSKVDEKKLDELVNEKYPIDPSGKDKYDSVVIYERRFTRIKQECFKKGYLKAMEE